MSETAWSLVSLGVVAGLVLWAVAARRALRRRVVAAEEQAERRQQELLQARLALARVTQEKLDLEEELGKKEQLAAVGELAAAVAHEVRNPLAVIVNACAGLKRPTLAAEDRSVLIEIVEEETSRLNRLVTDLLRFSRPVKLQRSRVSLAELAGHGAVAAAGHTFTVQVRTRDPAATVLADPSLLKIVIDGLIENACQAMPGGGCVTLSIDDEGEEPRRITLEVADEGHGMDAAVLARARDPFFTTRPSGTGLGLPIIQRIVEAHGGTLSLESMPGHGTRARVALPAIALAAVPVRSASGVPVTADAPRGDS